MKNVLIFITLFVFSINCYSQVSLKGVTLGEKYTIAESNHPIYESVAGVSGSIHTRITQDLRIFEISFGNYKKHGDFTTYDGFNEDEFLLALENHFGLKHVEPEKYEMGGEVKAWTIYENIKDGVEYRVEFTYWKNSIKNRLYLTITSLELRDLKRKIDEENRMNDF